MSILNKRYERLGPSLLLLADEAVLAQAWKKTDTYIRHHNWYADILELEHASLLLPSMLQAWSACISDDHSGLVPQKARVVWAPKNAKWHFPEGSESGWEPVPKSNANDQGSTSPLELRPLAHIGIKDQVLATAVMMCLADAVESMQGNTDSSSYTGRSEARKHVCSYGNRLYCDWSDGAVGRQQARFRWGNATTYSQFFKDYERFLERPAEACRDLLPALHGERLYVIKLDLTKFYDCIDQPTLLSRIQQVCKEYEQQFCVPSVDESATKFWQAATQVIKWTWNEKDQSKKNPLGSMGLPQGLVASGFFANAYLQAFDKQVGSQNGRSSNITVNEVNLSFRVLDYCRYVDDMRLVVAIPETEAKDLPLDTLAQAMSEWINGLLNKYEGVQDRLRTKPEKSEAIAWEDYAVQGSTSRFMRGVQGQISIAPDPNTLLQATGSLDHLLWLADALTESENVDANPLALARISLPKLDVRDDTIKRFAANRLRSVLRLRRSMADPELSADDALSTADVSELEALDHEIETIARKLVACWSRNPALVSVLRCGMDLYPSIELLRPVLSALLTKIDKAAKTKERLVATYVLADLFKAGAVETGLHRPESYPKTSDIDGYRSELIQLALRLASANSLPWYLHQQIALFLAVRGYPTTLAVKNGPVKPYINLHAALRFERPRGADAYGLTAGLIVLRVSGQRDKFVIWLNDWLHALKPTEAKEIIDHIAMIEPKVIEDLWLKVSGISKAKWVAHLKRYVPMAAALDKSSGLHSWRSGKRMLAAVSGHAENPFVQENALLKLAAKLLQNSESTLNDDAICIDRVEVKCENWRLIQDPAAELEVTAVSQGEYLPPWTTTPEWCTSDMRWAYRLGRLLRAAIIGDSDYTTRFFPLRENSFDRYRGLQSSWYKRRMGLMPLTSGLGAEPTPISPWLNELIMRLLQWPGLEISRDEIEGFDDIRSPGDLLKLVLKRQSVQRALYGKSSQLPAYVLPVRGQKTLDLSKFKVALVQTLMPKDRDFSAADPLMWTAAYRSRHRAHLASVCRLIEQQLVVNRFADRKPDAALARKVDLIVFPELSVHPDDMWLLHRLSDSTGATIFAGQTFVNHPFIEKPINRAVWLLRQESKAGRSIAKAYQGKQHGTPWEQKAGVEGHRPYQVLVQFRDRKENIATLTGAICFDATDLHLISDMREVSDGFVIAALNRDITTFDTLTSALQYHMYQPVILANTGQFGGSNAQAPYKERHERLITHIHGNEQAAVSVFEVDLMAFKSTTKVNLPKEKKSAPAGYQGRC